MATLDQHGESVHITNYHEVGWVVQWDWPSGVNPATSGMMTQLQTRYWYEKAGQKDTTPVDMLLKQHTFNPSMPLRIFAPLWIGNIWFEPINPPPTGGGWTLRFKYLIDSYLTWQENGVQTELHDNWNSGEYLHQM